MRKREQQTTKAFYRHSDGGIFCIEKNWSGVLIGSCGPLPEDNLKDLDSYECKADNLLWIQDQSDKLITM